jgi:hypothetical protein
MRTRDGHSIRSHAQKHFIKLYRDGLPLPLQVAESGSGYTLSGKPLDPDSAAARPYLLAKAKGKSLGSAPPPQPPSIPGIVEGILKAALKLIAGKRRESGQRAAPPRPSRQRNAASYQDEDSDIMDQEGEDQSLPSERTEYARSRPTRAAAAVKKVQPTFDLRY